MIEAPSESTVDANPDRTLALKPLAVDEPEDITVDNGLVEELPLLPMTIAEFGVLTTPVEAGSSWTNRSKRLDNLRGVTALSSSVSDCVSASVASSRTP